MMCRYCRHHLTRQHPLFHCRVESRLRHQRKLQMRLKYLRQFQSRLHRPRHLETWFQLNQQNLRRRHHRLLDK
jgi:hypothetical protein